MKAYTSQTTTSLRLKLARAKFATLRFTEKSGTIFVRDGKTYATENRMRSNLKGRPSTAKMVSIEKCAGGIIEFSEIA